MVRGSGGMPARKILKFRPSEITFGAFSGKTTLETLCCVVMY